MRVAPEARYPRYAAVLVAAAYLSTPHSSGLASLDTELLAQPSCGAFVFNPRNTSVFLRLKIGDPLTWGQNPDFASTSLNTEYDRLCQKSDPPKADKYPRYAAALVIAAYLCTPHSASLASLDLELLAHPASAGLFRRLRQAYGTSLGTKMNASRFRALTKWRSCIHPWLGRISFPLAGSNQLSMTLLRARLRSFIW